jgi:hypothetical protein
MPLVNGVGNISPQPKKEALILVAVLQDAITLMSLLYRKQ